MTSKSWARASARVICIMIGRPRLSGIFPAAMTSARLLPSSSSITMKEAPSSVSPWSWTSMMLGGARRCACFASRRKRSLMVRSLVNWGLRIFTAQGRSTSLCRAR